MNIKDILTTAMLTAFSAVGMAQQSSVHFDMTVGDGALKESVSDGTFPVISQLPALSVAGVSGEAMRFDGYSNYVRAKLASSSLSTTNLTINLILAPETFPMMNTAEAENTPTYATVFGNLDETAKQGFAIKLSSQGHLRFTFASAYAKGYLFAIDSSEKMTLGRWSQITAVLDKDANLASLYLNGNKVGTCKMSRSEIILSEGDYYIGKDATELKAGPFLINTFCGLIDDIAIYNQSLTPDQLTAVDLSATPDFNYPASRYAASLWRPQFHGMPSGGWTNECHGLTYSDGKYHVFFQKNANGPYMARLHWGHISSENLYKWTEEPIAIAPGEWYDMKGCWSGCVYDDDNGINAIYTAVDNGKARIVKATPDDKGLVEWTKQGVIIDGRPAGLSDDFRDPYFFTSGGNKYIIVGTSKDGIGASTLHKYDNGSWTNDGKIFFRGTNANQHGTFWEMPNVTDMGNGKMLFTVTPLNTGVGVRTIYWVGKINSDGTFAPDHDQPKMLEMGGISKDGYGLLSPSIYQKDGKTLLLGIVPDKMPGEVNYDMGWAHNYSLPREISIDANNNLVQKPYEGLTAMRTDVTASVVQELSGEFSLSPVSGRQIELLGEFTIGFGEMGFDFFKSDNGKARLAYNTADGILTLDLTSLSRRSNDGGPYNGVYAATLPEKPQVGEKLKLHVFIDGSIADIFVNDKWAYSVRIFPTDSEQTGVEVFATSPTKVDVKAWTLDADKNGDTAIKGVGIDPQNSNDRIYNIAGQQRSAIPQKGLYIQKGKKYVAH